jgi:uncharacterized protein YjbI with pentapeptide repeats
VKKIGRGIAGTPAGLLITSLWRRARADPIFWACTLTVSLSLLVASLFYVVIRLIAPPDESKKLDPQYPIQFALWIAGGIGGVVALVVAYRRQKVTEESIFVERFGAAAAQLGTEDPAVRMAGVYAMAGVADEGTPAQRQQCVDVLCGYLRLPYNSDGDRAGITQLVIKQSGQTPNDPSDETTIKYRLHDKEVRATIVRVLASHLRQDAAISWSSCNVDLSGAVLMDSHFSECRFDGKVSIVGATFSGDVSFGGATFSGEVPFGGATFSGDVSFGGATFSGDVSFDDAVFSRRAWFDKATFSRRASFDKATFSGPVGFGGATISGYAWFDKATFSGPASFDKATFSGPASFDKATFSGAPSFGGATFSGPTSFNKASFSRDVSFTGTTFSGDASFDDASFSGGARFHAATFSGRAWFPKATFSGRAWFPKATFSGPTSFGWATFSMGASFRGATFTDDAFFDEATFSANASFDEAFFPSMVDVDFRLIDYGSRVVAFRKTNFGPGVVDFSAPRTWDPGPTFDWDRRPSLKPSNILPVDWPPTVAEEEAR